MMTRRSPEAWLVMATATALALGCEGPKGPAGEQGPPGALGPAGGQGESGDPGGPGAPGDEGPAGPEGSEGPAGPAGPQGPEGAEGLDGPEGPEGSEGGPGPEGDPGPAGEPGSEGPEGPRGDTGAPGAPGAPGEGRTALFTDDGLVIAITAVDLDEAGHPLMTLRITDEAERPLDVAGYYTAGAIDLRFLAARWNEAEGEFFNYVTTPVGEVTQAGADADGSLTEIGPGDYLYTYGAVIPEGEAREAAHRLVVGARRTFEDGTRVGLSALSDYVPGEGAAEIPSRIDDSTCDACHQGIEGHGGRWTEVGACVTCHTSQTIDADTGNTVDFRVMVHKIHRGAGLPSVAAGEPYQLVGRGGVTDFSEGRFPRDLADCTTCHAGTVPDAWQQASLFACTTCHDRTAFAAPPPEGYTLHRGGPQPEASCGACHGPEGFASAAAAHADPMDGARVDGLSLVLDAAEVAPGAAPVVTFRVLNGAGNLLPLLALSSLELTVAGPTTGYAWRSTMSNVQTVAARLDDGSAYRVTADFSLPVDASGTVAVGLAGYRFVPYGSNRDNSVGREYGGNPVTYVALGGGEAEPRELAVDRELCNNCHGDLALHGTFRREITYCVTCHNPNATDVDRRPAEAGEPESVDFGPMIHRIHAGASLADPPVIYGFGNTAHDYGGVRYPGHVNECAGCHGENPAWTVASEAACTSCHDSPDARAHAASMAGCGVCHGPGRDASVEDAHR